MLFNFLAAHDLRTAERAREAIEEAYAFIETMPFACKKAEGNSPFLREIIISFGRSGYVALFEIESNEVITLLAFRHQREEDYY